MSRGIKLNRHKLLKTEHCELVHEASCRLLSETGVHVESRHAIEIYKKGGAAFEEGRVKIPRILVEHAIKQTAKRIQLGAQNPDNAIDINFDSPTVTFGTGGQALYVLDYDKQFTRRPANADDLRRILTLCENLDHIDFITRPVEPDVPEDQMDMEKLDIFMRHTTKHMNLANLVKLEKLPEIIKAVKDKTFISFIASLTVSPLNVVSPTVEKFMAMVEHDIPVSISSCPQAGATAPLSEIGELVQVNAEVLSAVVLANLIRTGAKVLYRGIPISSDLYTDGSPRWCQPESIRRVALAADMTYFYQIPCCGTAAVSDQKQPNVQALAEKTLSWVFEAASGAQFINSAAGMLEQVLTVCPEQYIIDDQIIGSIKDQFNQSPDDDIKNLAETAVYHALDQFDIKVTDDIKKDISDRIDFITSSREEYNEESFDHQVDLITRAVNSSSSSTKFMKAARKGLRSGWLYKADPLPGDLDLTAVSQRKKQILGA